MCLLSDPTNFAHIVATDSVSTVVSNIVNLQLGTTINLATAELTGNAKAWRVAYMSVTIFQDGPALSNQGTVVAAQYPMTPERYVSPSWCQVANSVNKVSSVLACTRYATRDYPEYTRLQTMPNAYFGNSKDGVYMPLKLDPNHVTWRTVGQQVMDGTAFAADGGSGFVVPSGTAAPSAGFPYAPTSVTPAFFNTSTSRWEGSRVVGPLSTNAGGICFKNLSVATGLSVVIRMGLEVQAHPGSVWGPYLRLAPPTDQVALSTYYAISRELKDAYPEDFNSFAKLWEVIKKAASVVAPALGFMGPMGAALHAGGSAIGSIIDSVSEKKKPAELAKDSPPAAAIERARDALRRAPATMRVAPRKKRTVKMPKRK